MYSDGPRCNLFSFFTVYKDKEPRGIIPLENLSIREVDDSKKPVNHILLYNWLISAVVLSIA